MTSFLWTVTIIVFLLALRERFGRYQMFQYFPQKKNQTSLLKKIAHTIPFQNISWITRQLSPEKNVKKRLQNAGSPLTFEEYLRIKEGVLRLFSLVLFFFLLFSDMKGSTLFLFLFYFGFFFFLLDIVLRIRKEKREKIFIRQVPYFIDLFILTLRTGMNIQQALECLVEKKSLLTNTIRKRLEELNFGRSLEEVFSDLEQEINNEEFQHFLRSLRQSQKLGVSLAYTLEIQSRLIRTKRKQCAEEISRTAAVKISLPLVLFIFPALLIIYIGPGIMNVL